jgi:hypothetical protein
MIVARHEVPGTASTQKRRPVGYGLIRAGVPTNGSEVSAVNKRQAGSRCYIALWPHRLRVARYAEKQCRIGFQPVSCWS